MLSRIDMLWDALFPRQIRYPLRLIGSPEHPIQNPEQLEMALRKWYNIFTYRSHFEGITTETGFVAHTDQGWGCLLRTSQMLLAHFLHRHGKCGDFRLCLFADECTDAAAFSIHNMVKSVCDHKPFYPEYWTPSQACEAVRKTVASAVEAGVLRTNFSVVCSSSGCLFSADVEKVLRGNCEAVLLLTPVRISTAPRLTQETYLELESLMYRPECLGVVGGALGRSYYFFGYSATQMICLDPHQAVQSALTSTSPSGTIPTVSNVRGMHWSRMDTSLSLAFGVRNLVEWHRLRENIGRRFLCIERTPTPNPYRLRSQDVYSRASCMKARGQAVRASSANPPKSINTKRTPALSRKAIAYSIANRPMSAGPNTKEVEFDDTWDRLSEL